jgi:hypothetical protein
MRGKAHQPGRRHRRGIELRCTTRRIEIPAQDHSAIRQIRGHDAQIRRHESPTLLLALELHRGIEAIDRGARRSRAQIASGHCNTGLADRAGAKPQQQARIDLACRQPGERGIELAKCPQFDRAGLDGRTA